VGLHDNAHVDGTLYNFSSEQLIKTEIEILAKTWIITFLSSSLQPCKKIKVEFENAYSGIKRQVLAPKSILGLKVKLLQPLYICLLQTKETPSC